MSELADWGLVLFGVLGGAILLFRPRLLGLPDSFPGSTALGFLLLAAGMTAPLVLRPNEILLDAGEGTDAFIGAWNLWLTQESVAAGQNPYFTDLLFAPEGTDLSLHTHSVTYGILLLPLTWVFGQAGPPGLFGVYNLAVLMSFALSGYVLYRLALSLTGHREAALLAGLVFAFSAFRFANTVRLHVLALEWMALLVWAWVALWRAPSPARLVATAGAALLLLHASLELSAYTAMLLAGWTLVEFGSRLVAGRRPSAGRSGSTASGRARGGPRATRSRSVLPLRTEGESRDLTRVRTSDALGIERAGAPAPSRRAWIAGAVTAAGLVFAGAMPLAWRLAHRLGEAPPFEARVAEHFSADLLDFFLPNPRHPLWGETFARITGGFHFGDAGFGLSLGLVPVLLFLLAAREVRRAGEGRRWWLGAVACLVLALGPVLQVGGHDWSGVPMPQEALQSLLPILGRSRTPLRWVAPASLCLSLAIAYGWALRARRDERRVLERLEGRGHRGSAGRPRRAALVALAVLFFALPAPLEFTDEPIPEVYRHVARVARTSGLGRTTLLHLPGMLPRESLLYQTVHGQRLIEDLSPAVPLHSATLSALRDDRYAIFVRELARPGALSGLGRDGAARAVADLRAYLAANRIHWIVVPSMRDVQEWALGETFPSSVYGPTVYEAYRTNLRLLEPLEELELEGLTVFRF